MVGERPAVLSGRSRLDPMPTGSCQLCEHGWEVVDGRVAVAYEEDTGARRGVQGVPATGPCGQSQREKDRNRHRNGRREIEGRARPSTANTAIRVPAGRWRGVADGGLVRQRVAGGQANPTQGTNGVPGAVPRPASTAYQIAHEADLRITAVNRHDPEGRRDLRTWPAEPPDSRLTAVLPARPAISFFPRRYSCL